MTTSYSGGRRGEAQPFVRTLDKGRPTYTSIDILSADRGNRLDMNRRYGQGILDTLNVKVVRTYPGERKKPRTSLYEVRAAYQIGDDAPDDLPVVSHSDALFTTSKPEGTATYHYFINPVKAGFSVVNVGPKRHGGTLPVEEMADDKLAITKVVADELGLGIEPDEEGVTELGISGYSRGIILGIVAADRAGLQNMRVDYMQGVAPGPRNKESIQKLAGRVLMGLRHDFATLVDHTVHEPVHAFHNRAVFPLSPTEILSYHGDTDALHGGEIGAAITRLDRDNTRGHLIVLDHDSLGLPKDYSVDFEAANETASIIRPFSDFKLITLPGTHTTPLKKELVAYDRDAWMTEADRRRQAA